MSRVWKVLWFVSWLIGAAGLAYGQTLVMQQDAAGDVTLVPGVSLTTGGAESPSWIAGQTNATGGIDWTIHTAPINKLTDTNNNTLSSTVETLKMDSGLTISTGGTRIGEVDIDPNYRPAYTVSELTAMGAVTSSLPQSLGSIYTEGSQFALKEFNGTTRVLGMNYTFMCTGLTITATKYYCPFGITRAAALTRANGEILLGHPCNKVKSVSTTWFDNAGTARANSPTCTIDIGKVIGATDTSIGSVTSGTSSATFTPSVTFSWTSTDEVGLYVSGSCSSATASIAFSVECY